MPKCLLVLQARYLQGKRTFGHEIQVSIQSDTSPNMSTLWLPDINMHNQIPPSIFPYCKQSKTGGGNGLGMRLAKTWEQGYANFNLLFPGYYTVYEKVSYQDLPLHCDNKEDDEVEHKDRPEHRDVED